MKPFKFSRKNREYTKWGKNLKEVRVFPKPKPAPAAVPAGEAGPGQLQAGSEGDTEQGAYANSSVITNTGTEFLLDFIFQCPGQPGAKVVKRVILTPAMAVLLCMALREDIKKYEARFGPVKA